MQKLKIVECPRDAMQGIHEFIPTEVKSNYINRILKCGFDTVDFGSFVSPRAIPQMKDTALVLDQLDDSPTKLLAIAANPRGAELASEFDRIQYLGYPFSLSEKFQMRNTNSTIDESFARVEAIQEIASKKNKELVLYLSMGFGNPYGEEWHPDIVTAWSEKLYSKLDVKIQEVSDTIGVGNPEIVNTLFSTLIPSLPNVEFGAHLHTIRENAKPLIAAAYNAGCRRFDGAIKGYGGCPMAKDDLTGNMPTEIILEWLKENSIDPEVDLEAFNSSMGYSATVFP